MENFEKVPSFKFKALYENRNDVESAILISLLRIKDCDKKKFDLKAI